MIKTRPEKSIQNLLRNPQKDLNQIIAKAELLAAVDVTVKAFLPAHFKHQCAVANQRQGTLILQVDNAAVATQIRFQVPELLTKLRSEGKMPYLTSIEIIVRSACT